MDQGLAIKSFRCSRRLLILLGVVGTACILLQIGVVQGMLTVYGIHPRPIFNSDPVVSTIGTQTVVLNVTRELDDFKRHVKYFKEGKKQVYEHDSQSNSNTSLRATFKTNTSASNTYNKSSVKGQGAVTYSTHIKTSEAINSAEHKSYMERTFGNQAETETARSHLPEDASNVATGQYNANPMRLLVTNGTILIHPRLFQEMNNDIDNESTTAYTNSTTFNTQTNKITALPGDVRHDWPEYVKNTLAIFILSAIGCNFTTTTGYRHDIKLNGWQGAKHSQVDIKCCISWNSGHISQYLRPSRTTQGKSIRLSAAQYTCPTNGSLVDIEGVTLVFAKKECPTNASEYIKPFIPNLQVTQHSFAVCLKILYGNVDNKLLVDWIEYYREMKVDKIFMFLYNISTNTDDIITHYTKIGIVDTRTFAFPWKHGRDVGMKVPGVWEDEQVVVYDCFYRLHGYRYIAIVDMDEFLFPRIHHNIHDLMKNLTNTYPLAAGYSLKIYLFNKDWARIGRVNASDIEQYIQRTPALVGVRARQKNILLPSRVLVDSSLHTHYFKPKQGFESFVVPESIVAINHYRSCYTNLEHVCKNSRRIIDTDILKVVGRFQNRTRWYNNT